MMETAVCVGLVAVSASAVGLTATACWMLVRYMRAWGRAEAFLARNSLTSPDKPYQEMADADAAALEGGSRAPPAGRSPHDRIVNPPEYRATGTE